MEAKKKIKIVTDQIVTFCEFLGNLRKLSTQNTIKYYRNDLVVGTV